MAEEKDPFSAPGMAVPIEEKDPFSAPGMAVSKTAPIDEFDELDTRSDIGQDDTLGAADDIAATASDLRKMSTTALDPMLELGPAGETGLTAWSSLYGMPIDREAFAMAGALTGESMGYKIAKKPGMYYGGLLGAGVSSLGFDTVDGLIKFLQRDPEQELTPDIKRLGDAIARAGGKMSDEAVGILGAHGILGMLAKGKSGIMKLFGTNDPQVAELASLAAAENIPLGITHAVADDKWAKEIVKVLGILPVISRPFKRAAKEIEMKLGEGLFRTLNAFAPKVYASGIMGEAMVRTGSEKFDLFHETSEKLFKKWEHMVTHLPKEAQAFIPTKTIKKRAETILAQLDGSHAGSADLRNNGQLRKWLENVATYKNRLTPDQFAGEVDSLNQLLEEFGEKKLDDLFPSGNSLRKAFEADLANPALNFVGSFKDGVKLAAGVKDPDAVTGKMIRDSLIDANKFYVEGLQDFINPTTQKILKVIPGAFRVKARNVLNEINPETGSKNADEIFSSLFKYNSREGLEQLQKVLGKKGTLSALRTYIDEAMEKSTAFRDARLAAGGLEEMGLVLPDKNALNHARKALGLGTRNGELILAQALKGSKVTVDGINKIFRLIASQAKSIDPSVSSYIARRITLGGASAGFIGAGYLAGDKEGGLGAALALVILGNRGAAYLTNPKNLRTLTTVLDKNATKTALANAAGRLIQDLSKEVGTSWQNLSEEEKALNKYGAYQPLVAGPTSLVTGGGKAVKGYIEEKGDATGQAIVNALRNNLTPKVKQKISSAVGQWGSDATSWR